MKKLGRQKPSIKNRDYMLFDHAAVTFEFLDMVEHECNCPNCIYENCERVSSILGVCPKIANDVEKLKIKDPVFVIANLISDETMKYKEFMFVQDRSKTYIKYFSEQGGNVILLKTNVDDLISVEGINYAKN